MTAVPYSSGQINSLSSVSRPHSPGASGISIAMLERIADVYGMTSARSGQPATRIRYGEVEPVTYTGAELYRVTRTWACECPKCHVRASVSELVEVSPQVKVTRIVTRGCRVCGGNARELDVHCAACNDKGFNVVDTVYTYLDMVCQACASERGRAMANPIPTYTIPNHAGEPSHRKDRAGRVSTLRPMCVACQQRYAMRGRGDEQPDVCRVCAEERLRAVSKRVSILTRQLEGMTR